MATNLRHNGTMVLEPTWKCGSLSLSEPYQHSKRYLKESSRNSRHKNELRRLTSSGLVTENAVENRRDADTASDIRANRQNRSSSSLQSGFASGTSENGTIGRLVTRMSAGFDVLTLQHLVDCHTDCSNGHRSGYSIPTTLSLRSRSLYPKESLRPLCKQRRNRHRERRACLFELIFRRCTTCLERNEVTFPLADNLTNRLPLIAIPSLTVKGTPRSGA